MLLFIDWYKSDGNNFCLYGLSIKVVGDVFRNRVEL